MPTLDRTYTLIGRDGKSYLSRVPGKFGGSRGGKIYGCLDCRAALQAIARGGYVKNRVFFLDEVTAVAAGYRPCAVCLPTEYEAWKSKQPVKVPGSAKKESRLSLLQSATESEDNNASLDALEGSIAAVDWGATETALRLDGYAALTSLLTPEQCDDVSDYFFQDARFRSRVVMERYSFGRGEYRYFSYPLPDLVGRLRQSLYPHLVPIANRWHSSMRIEQRFPETHAEFRDICHRAGQQRPTPLLLRYQTNDYCCLHQDLYGEHVFPFQAIILLSEPGHDFEGGELLLTESNPKKPGRVDVVPLNKGDAIILAVNHRPVRSVRGFYRANQRHGVSRLLWGQRHTLGIIFHDAK